MIEDIHYLVTQLAERLNCAWANQHGENQYRLDFADGLSIAVKKTWRDKLYIGVMLGHLERYLNYNEQRAHAEFNTTKVGYITTYIENNILPLAREQFKRVTDNYMQMREKARQRWEIALAIAAQFKGEPQEINTYDYLKSLLVHQYAPYHIDGVDYPYSPSASYDVSHWRVDIKASVTPDMAVWLAYVIQNPEILKEMGEIYARNFKV